MVVIAGILVSSATASVLVIGVVAAIGISVFLLEISGPVVGPALSAPALGTVYFMASGSPFRARHVSWGKAFADESYVRLPRTPACTLNANSLTIDDKAYELNNYRSFTFEETPP